jgi:hypothetical protein
MNKKANALIEYALIILIVIAAFFTMNIYMKRGLQGRVKDMADYFIGGGTQMQANTAVSRATTTSEANTTSDSSVATTDSFGGARSTGSSEQTSIKATSKTEDMRKIVVPDSGVATTGVSVPAATTETYTPSSDTK